MVNPFLSLKFSIQEIENSLIAKPYDEKEFLLRISQGDHEAFRALYENYYGFVYSLSFRFLKIHELAEDTVQLCFLKIWEKRTILPTVDRFDAYLFITARNELTNQFRKQVNHFKYIQRIREMFEEEAGSPEILLIGKQRLSLINEAIGRLPAQQQKVYRLSREKGQSYQEIADNMGLSISTIRGTISAALNSLREFFIEHKNDFYFILMSCFIRWIYK